ncbi:tripartite tricarboxylate transporter substrate binding protein [Domibacillus robiginosus]|uniref:tripartite tricarboxylate transporter substrate binding protein n=1 Tax=Domibacillus robiginosus TaxID=1071054 RepID=UPI00067D6021|nr:tripartite tricarboxylate transporter substrate-binding protein [Domibacillus robiginosus]
MKRLVVLLLIFLTAGCSASSVPLEEQPLTFIVPGSPHGGWDALAKSIKAVAEKEQLTENSIHIVYEEGDGGNDGWARLNKSDASTIAMTSSLLLTNELLGHSNLRYEDFTPLATMASEWQAVIVADHSSVASIGDLMDKLQKNPGRYPIGIEPQFGNDDQIAFAQAAHTKGIPAASLRFFRYADGSSLIQALQQGEIAAASLSSSQSEDFAENQNVRIIAISSAKRLDHLPDVPTWKEQGIDVVFPHWRGVMGPGHLTKAEQEWWSEFLTAVQSSPYWKEELKKNHWTHFYRNSADTDALLRSETKKYRYMMNQK